MGLYQNGTLTNVFPVATGLERSYTPEGQFSVACKIVEPPYYKLHIPGGSPNNPLGPRWVGLSIPGGAYGIHGNSNPASIGTYASAGCIRMRNEDILWLYDQIPVGTPVEIVWQDKDLNDDFIDNTPVKITMNNNVYSGEQTTLTWQGRPYISLKFLCQQMGCGISWNPDTSTVDLTTNGVVIHITPYDQRVLFNTEAASYSEAPIMVNGVTFMTKSTIEETFPVNVQWNQTTREVQIVPR